MKQGMVSVAGADIHYIQDGDGPDIVWIPGGDQTCEVYHSQFDAFRDSFRCTCFDPRGVGKTVSRSDPPWPIAAFAADCAELIRQVCEPPVVLAGLSLGALIVQEVALSHPELVRIAVPMGTIARKTGFTAEWERAEIALAAKGGSLPGDFSVVHYAALCYPAEVLGDDALWRKVRPYLDSAYDDRDPAMLAAQWQACRVVAEAAGNGHFHLLQGMGHLSIFGHRPEAVTECIRRIIAVEEGAGLGSDD
jgi:pimeloyl-ACP methyl ester carboxylesterase